MTILELQNNIATALNGLETLIQGGCKCFAEDSLSVEADANKQLQLAKGVVGIVLTPSIRRSGGGEGTSDLAVEASVSIAFTEIPAANRKNTSHLTAMDCAAIAAEALDGDQITFDEISQSADEQKGLVIATAKFGISFLLSTTPSERT